MTASPTRILLLASLLCLALLSVWSWRTPVVPNSDRYDYAGRAWNATQGKGLRPLVVYPLRLALPGAASWPPENLTRPPVWPALLVPLVRAHLGDRAGVLLAALCTGWLLLLLTIAGERTFGPGAGGAAALACACSFAVARALWGGGPELAMALVTYVLWTWRPREQGRLAHLACGSLYGLLPLLHPFGWVIAMLAAVAREDRYAKRNLVWLMGGALLVATPWHVRGWVVAQRLQFYVQAWAELAKEVLDPSGMGPYRGLTLMSAGRLLADMPGAVFSTWLRHAHQLATHLDGWMSWPLLLAAVLGARHAPRLAARDAVTLLLGGAIATLWSGEPRLLVPLLPMACTWAGAAVAGLSRRTGELVIEVLVVSICVAPWVLPLGRTARPGTELRSLPTDRLRPPGAQLRALERAGDRSAAFFTDSAVLAWRARRPALFLPETPALLEQIREHPALRRARVIALTAGRHSVWTKSAQSAWDSLLARADVLEESPSGGVLVRLPPRATSSAPPSPADSTGTASAATRAVARPDSGRQ